MDVTWPFDIGFALPRSPIKGLRRALSEDGRRVTAKAIVAQLRLCGERISA